MIDCKYFKISKWDIFFAVVIGILILILADQIIFYVSHRCPAGLVGKFINDKFYCLNESVLEGGEDYGFSGSLAWD